MKALIQRVKHAQVTVDNRIISHIDQGMLVFVGIDKKDGVTQVAQMAHKLLHYRIFSDNQGKMNLNIQQTQGGGAIG